MLCVVCHSSELRVFHEGPAVPVFVNVLHDTTGSARSVAKGRMELAVCGACGHVFNVGFDPRLVEYAPGYENSLHGSPTFHTWAVERARALVARHGAAGQHAIDVGGGRGEFMALLVDAGVARGLVVDPSAPNLEGVSRPRGFTVERRLFRPEDVAPDTHLVLSRHVLEHLPDPLELARLMSREAARVGAGVYLEVPNGLFTLRDLGIWDLIYEHCSYFTPSSLRTLAQRAGRARFELTEEFHGQFLALDSAGPRGTTAPRDMPRGLEPAEVIELCRDFAAAHRAVVAAWSTALDRRRATGVALWGAGAKGATFLNSIDGASAVRCAVDLNALKHDKFVAGTGHPIVAPERLGEVEVGTVVVLNSAYAAEIGRAARALGLEVEVLTADKALAEASR